MSRGRKVWITLYCLAMTAGLVALFFYTGDTRTEGEQTNAQQDRSIAGTLCAQAFAVATAFRDPADDESPAHFRSRMEAQREVLIRSRGLDCNIDGLAKRRREALHEIRAVLAPDKVKEQSHARGDEQRSEPPGAGDGGAGSSGDGSPGAPTQPVDPPDGGGGEPPVEPTTPTTPTTPDPDPGSSSLGDQIGSGVGEIVNGATSATCQVTSPLTGICIR